MAKLADLIRRATKGEPAPLGFGSTREKPPASMVLVALAAKRWPQAASDAVAAGADALFLTGRPNEKEITEAIAAADGHPCGLLATDDADLSALHDAGLDFLALSPDAPARLLQKEDPTFLLRVDHDLTDVQLRTIDALPVDALYLDAGSAPLTISRQMEIQRVSGLTHKSIMLSVASDSTQDDLLSLRESGVALIAVDMANQDAAETLRHLRGLIDALPKRGRQRGQERPGVTLPTVFSHDHEEDDEDE